MPLKLKSNIISHCVCSLPTLRRKHTNLPMNDISRAVLPVVKTLEALKIRYLIGGSVASVAYGLVRSTMDIDIVAEMTQPDSEPFFEALRQDYYIDLDMIREAVQRNGSFNIIHLATMFKVDMFISEDSAFDRQQFDRRLPPPTSR